VNYIAGRAAGRRRRLFELPTFVRRLVIPILYVVGRVFGKYEKYRDAPEAIALDRR
jgi:hypothetical protein